MDAVAEDDINAIYDSLWHETSATAMYLTAALIMPSA